MIELKTWGPKPAVESCIGWRVEDQSWQLGIWAAGWWCQSPKRGTIRTVCRLEGGHEHGGWDRRMGRMG